MILFFFKKRDRKYIKIGHLIRKLTLKVFKCSSAECMVLIHMVSYICILVGQLSGVGHVYNAARSSLTKYRLDDCIIQRHRIQAEFWLLQPTGFFFQQSCQNPQARFYLAECISGGARQKREVIPVLQIEEVKGISSLIGNNIANETEGVKVIIIASQVKKKISLSQLQCT